MDQKENCDLICKHCGLVLHSTQDRDYLMYRHIMKEHSNIWAQILMEPNSNAKH